MTVEVNTIFGDLNSVLSQIDPAKLNETLGAVSTASNGRGETFGRSLTDFNGLPGNWLPSLPALSHELQTLPDVATAYADAAPDLLGVIGKASLIRESLVEEQSDLDRFLVSAIGLPREHRQRRPRRQPGGADQSSCTCWFRQRAPDQRVSRGPSTGP